MIVQHPGSDNSLQITTGGTPGQVINRKTNATIFTFTGSGSLTDTAAVTALSSAFEAPGVDDVYTKMVFTILPAGETVPTYPGNTLAPSATSPSQPATPGATTLGTNYNCQKGAGRVHYHPRRYCSCLWCNPLLQETITSFFLK